MNMYDHFGFMPPFFQPLGLVFFPIFMLLAVWTIVIKGIALWHAARSGQKWWFVVLLVVNTLGILEVVYLIWFRSDRKTVSAKDSVVTPIDSESAKSMPVAESSNEEA